MKLTKSNEILKSKPTKGTIKSTLKNIIDITASELEWIVLNNPFNVSEASGLTEADWKSQQIFALDFDSGIKPDEFIKKCRIHSLNPNIIYTTYSDKPELRKFRALFILDEPINEYLKAKWIQRGLMKLFPEADKACKDLCRMFYPGKEIIFRLNEANEKDWFINYTHAQFGEDNPRFYEKFDWEDDGKRPDIIEKFNWETAINEIKILDTFFNGRNRVSYEILFALITNAQYISGGINKIFERMREVNKLGGGTYFPDINRGVEKYPASYFTSLSATAIRRYNYKPKSLRNFSPFEDDWEYKNLLEIKWKRGKIEILKERELISLINAEKLLKDSYKLAKEGKPFEINYSKPDMITGESFPYIKELDALFNPLPHNPIYLFKITTGAGKSQAFINETEALIALPFHRLKEEMSDRMLVEHKMTPEAPLFSNQFINETISQLRDAGLYTEVGNIIKSIAGGSLKINKQIQNITSGDIDLAKLYLSINEDCRRDKTTVLTTHTRAINDLNSFKHDFYIFDEDPLNDIVHIETMSLDFTSFDGSPYESFVKPIEEHLRNLTENCVLDFPRFNKPAGFDKFCASIGKGYLIKLLKADFIYKDDHDKSKVHFCFKKEFLPEKKIFIMSATAPVPIYKKLFENRLIVIDITNIKPMGIVEQYTKRSFSSKGMTEYNMKIWKELYENINGTKVITHLKHHAKFKNYMNISDGSKHNFYFGNCSGGDALNGQDISVVGTPNKPSYVYLFLAELIGLPNSADQSLNNRIIEWNDFRFRFFTFEDPTLRDIQLSLIEAELLQAAGRSRFLRNKNTTKIFSSLPLKITTNFYEK